MGSTATPTIALVRFSGDLGTKARATRSQFRNRLISNLRDCLIAQGIHPQVRVSHNRVFIELPDPEHLEALTHVMGISSISSVERRPARDLDELVEAAHTLFAEAVAGQRFAVRARRVGDRARIALKPAEVESAVGARLLPHAARVDLSNPEVTVSVELIADEAYLFSGRLPGPGGIPLGAGGHAIALLSGGFDSAVAAWRLLLRGVALDYAFCNLGGETHQQGVLRVAKVLADEWSYGDRPRLHAIDFEPISEQLRARTRARYWQVLLKRLMLRAAEIVVRERQASAIVTGDAVGQVSSQTLPNLAVISRATEETILRPLVGSNKEEIIDLAQRIGTFEVSKVVGEYCAMVSTRPATAAKLDVIEAEEAKLDLSMVDEAVANRAVFELRSLDVEAMGIRDLEIEQIPDGATVIDLRRRDEYRSWCWPGALHLEFGRALEAWPGFDASSTYVLYCEIGLKSAHLAEHMRKAGFDAYHIRGGVPALRRRSR